MLPQAKRIVPMLLGVALLVTAVLLVRSPGHVNSSSPRQDVAKIWIPHSDDPAEQQANWDRAMQQVEHERAVRMAELKALKQREMDRWHGTTCSVKEEHKSSAIHKWAASLFENDPPAPPARKAAFAWCEDDPATRVVGYSSQVDSVMETDNGWEIVLHVRPKLLSHRGAVTFTPHACIETWTVKTPNSPPVNKSCEEVDKTARLIMTD